MITTLAESPFTWIDILNPTKDELEQMASRYGIHDAFVADVLQPEHLPKYEPVGNTSFFILRYYSANENAQDDTIQGLTNKVAVFQSDSLVITIHRAEVQFIKDLKSSLIDTGQCNGPFHLLNRLVRSVLESYESPANTLAKNVDYYESEVFLKQNTPPLLKDVYHVKRKIEVSRRLLILSQDILDHIDDPERQDPNTRDTRDLHVRVLTLFETMSENTNHLLALYFSVSAQRTNEVIRVLTLFSVFFMPLTFIVGIYGMNFDWMPELRMKFGYPAVMGVMAMVTIIIYSWFRRKGWL